MTSARSLSIRSILVLILVVTMPFAAYAKDKVAKVSGSSSSIDFSPSADHDALTLTIGYPDGRVYQKTFQSGNNPTVRVNDLAKDAPDGSYTYELRLVPRISASVKARLAAARKTNDDATIQQIQRENGLTEQVVQSGAFGYANGSFLSLDAPEPAGSKAMTSDGEDAGGGAASAKFGRPQANDQVIPDDLIVQSSICAGFDCVDGENFGFDTLRLKENNLRIHFEDTSTAGGYPANDWRLIANDSASGGANKFSIEDSTAARNPFTIEAAAPANALYVRSTGKVGIQQSVPLLDVHITTGDTPAQRFEQTNASGFTAQTWDVGANEANFFVRDLTGGSKLPFRIRPGAPTSSVDIAADGDVGIGVASPNTKTRMDLNDGTQAKARIALTGQEFFAAGNTSTEGISFVLGVNRTANRQLWIGDTANLGSASTYIRVYPNAGELSAISASSGGTVVGSPLTLNSAGGNVGIGITPSFPIHHSNGAHLTTGGAWTNASSRELKKDVQTLDADAAKKALEQLEPVTYEYKNEPGNTYAGFIAEDVPALVATPDRKSLSSMDVVAVLTKVVKEQQKTIEQLTERLAAIEEQKSNESSQSNQ